MPSYNEETGKMFCTVNATYGNLIYEFLFEHCYLILELKFNFIQVKLDGHYHKLKLNFLTLNKNIVG